jgi:hypothetical protein
MNSNINEDSTPTKSKEGVQGMELCCILQTEVYCVPTQLLLIDCRIPSLSFNSDRLCSLMKEELTGLSLDYLLMDLVTLYSSGISSEYQGILPILGEDSRDLTPINLTDEKSAKLHYIKNRAFILHKISELHSKRLKEGSRGRIVVWLIGSLELEDTKSSFGSWSSFIVNELALDIGNCRF